MADEDFRGGDAAESDYIGEPKYFDPLGEARNSEEHPADPAANANDLDLSAGAKQSADDGQSSTDKRSSTDTQSSAEKQAADERFRFNAKKRKQKGKFKGSFFNKKNFATSSIIIMFLVILIGSIVVLIIANTTTLSMVVDRIAEEYNSVGLASVIRSDNLLDLQLASVGSPISLSDYQSSSLEEYGITTIEYGGTHVLVYQRPNNKHAAVVTTALLEDTGVAGYIQERFADDSTFELDSVHTILGTKKAMDDPGFEVPYTRASKLWRGGVAGWYDSLSMLSETVHSYTRARWANYFQAVSKGASVSLATMAKPVIKALSIDNSEKAISYVDESDETAKVTTTDEALDSAGKNVSQQAKTAIAIGKFLKGADAANAVAGVGCAIVEGIVAIQTVQSAVNRLNGMDNAARVIESEQVSRYSNIVNAPAYQSDPEHEEISRLFEPDENGLNALQSEGAGALLYGEKVNKTDASFLGANSEAMMTSVANDAGLVNELSAEQGVMGTSVASTLNEVLGGARNFANTLAACHAIKGAINAASGIASLAIIAIGVSTLGVGGLVSTILTKTTAGIIAGAFGRTILAALTAMAPTIAMHFAEKHFLASVGEDILPGAAYGDSLFSAANLLVSANAQTGGQTPAATSKVAAYKNIQTEVIAREARYQRATLSPFDYTSRYTFLGSLAYAALPLAAANSLSGALSAFASIAGRSLAALSPGASAVAETNLVGLADAGDCLLSETIDIQASPYCQALMIEDVDNLNQAADHLNPNNPNNVYNQELALGNIVKKEDGTYELNPDKASLDNGLLKFMLFCGQRTSDWGIPDANIASSMKSMQQRNIFVRVLAIIPGVGSIFEAYDNAVASANMPWTTGYACVAADDNPYWHAYTDQEDWNNPIKEYNKTHQAFIAAERYMENINPNYETLVYHALNDHYQKNPLDNSYEGIIARYSGMTKTDVVATLNLIDTVNYIANYDPSERSDFSDQFNPEFEFTWPDLDSLAARVKRSLQKFIDSKEPRLFASRQQAISVI